MPIETERGSLPEAYEKGYGRLLELGTVSGEGCAPEIPVMGRRESMMNELTKHMFCSSYSPTAELSSHVTR